MSHKSPNLSTASSEALPWVVIAEEILPRLPLKSLSRFKCVSRLWNSHISTPHFSRNLHPVFHCWSETGPKRELHFVLRGNQFTKLERAPQSYWYDRKIRSCTTRSVLPSTIITTLRNPSTLHHPIPIFSPHISFSEPREFCIAIGHDARTGHYKVVHFGYGSRLEQCWLPALSPTAYVYFLKAREWKSIRIDGETGVLLRADINLKISWQPQCSADGRRIHWLANYEDRRRSILEGKTWRRRMLVSFDMCDEAFGLMNLPECLANVNDREHVELASLVGNNLVTLFVYNEELRSRTEYFVWVMKEYGVADSWGKVKITLGEPGRPLGYLNKFKFLFLLNQEKILLYDTMTQEKECIGIHDTRILAWVGNYM